MFGQYVSGKYFLGYEVERIKLSENIESGALRIVRNVVVRFKLRPRRDFGRITVLLNFLAQPNSFLCR